MRKITIVLLALLPSFALAQAPRIPSDNSANRFGATASASGTTAAVTATIPAVQGMSAYLCGFVVTVTNATAAQAGSITTTGLTNNLQVGVPTLAAGAAVPSLPPTLVTLYPCQPASGQNTAIAVISPALGAGATLNTVSAWGYYDRSY
jgi:hypothetical protein